MKQIVVIEQLQADLNAIDRLLLAQTQSENFYFLAADTLILNYDFIIDVRA